MSVCMIGNLNLRTDKHEKRSDLYNKSANFEGLKNYSGGIDDKHISFTATGTIIGSTANTITVQTDDGAVDTFRIENAQDLTESGVEYGDYVCVTFHPSKSKSSNIYTAVKIQYA